MATIPSTPEFADLLTTGEEAVSRDVVNSLTIGMSTQTLRLSYFTAKKDETITQVLICAGTTPAGATPSLVRVGVWTADAAGALLLQVGATPNDTTLLATTITEYTKSFSSSFATVRGTRYACGLLVVTAATAPQVIGTTFGSVNSIMGRSPMRGSSAGSQADLPSTLASGSVGASVNRPYFILLP